MSITRAALLVPERWRSTSDKVIIYLSKLLPLRSVPLANQHASASTEQDPLIEDRQ